MVVRLIFLDIKSLQKVIMGSVPHTGKCFRSWSENMMSETQKEKKTVLKIENLCWCLQELKILELELSLTAHTVNKKKILSLRYTEVWLLQNNFWLV